MINQAANERILRRAISGLTLAAVLLIASYPTVESHAQGAPTDPLSPAELETLVGPIALYPDDVLAIVLPASTYPLEIVQAARFLEDRESDSGLQPAEDWDDSVVALLNYPDVLRLMNEDIDWTWDLGEAVLDDEAAVLDAIQVFRDRAYEAGNLLSDGRQVVTESDGVIEIAPADPEVVYIPYYEPETVVVYQPRPVFHYYPYAYPLYYYPYPIGYHFNTGYFWGVTSAFDIGWHSHFIHVYHQSQITHPYYRRTYYTPYYYRSGVHLTVNVNNYRNVWRPGRYRGARPYDGYRATGADRVRRTYDGRRYRYSTAGTDTAGTRSVLSGQTADKRAERNWAGSQRPATRSGSDGTGRTTATLPGQGRGLVSRRDAPPTVGSRRPATADERTSGTARGTGERQVNRGITSRPKRPTTTGGDTASRRVAPSNRGITAAPVRPTPRTGGNVRIGGVAPSPRENTSSPVLQRPSPATRSAPRPNRGATGSGSASRVSPGVRTGAATRPAPTQRTRVKIQPNAGATANSGSGSGSRFSGVAPRARSSQPARGAAASRGGSQRRAASPRAGRSQRQR